MIRWTVDAVGLPGLAAFAFGFLLFFVALLGARRRARRATTVAETQARASWFWIGVQGCGIAAGGLGPIIVDLDPLGAKALAEAAVVLGLMLGAAALFRASSLAMGANWSLVARTRSDHQLVQAGPFAVVRHPIYVALFLLTIAMAVAYGHTRNLIVGLPLYAIGTWFRIRHEEALLRRQFGKGYDAYAARVKRFVPGVF